MTSALDYLAPVASQFPSVSAQVWTSVSEASAVSPAAAKLRNAAGDFEAILLESLWKSMKETFKDPQDDGSDPSLQAFDDWGMQAMASAVGNSGGLGIKNMILKYLEPRLNEGSGGAASARSSNRLQGNSNGSD